MIGPRAVPGEERLVTVHGDSLGAVGRESIKVACRVRPAARDEPRVWFVFEKTVAALPPPSPRPTHMQPRDLRLPSFQFDQVFGEDSTNQQVYSEFCQVAVSKAIAGCNSSLLLYGQTGAGKTHTVSGTNGEKGVLHFAMQNIFASARGLGQGEFFCSLSVVAIYNEKALDMLHPDCPEPLVIAGKGVLRDKNRRPLTSRQLKSVEEAREVFHVAERRRMFATTNKNARSSRSHTIFIIDIHRAISEEDRAQLVGGAKEKRPSAKQQGWTRGSKGERVVRGGIAYGAGGPDGGGGGSGIVEGEGGGQGGGANQMLHTRGRLYLVDLAGSESTKESGATGERKRETENINKSLLALTEVLMHLSRGGAGGGGGGGGGQAFYRRSMLTQVLRPCLGGARENAFAAMVFCIDPLNLRVSEKTLKYGLITKAIQIQYGIQVVRQMGGREGGGGALDAAAEAELSSLKREVENLRAENMRLEEQRMALLLIWRRGMGQTSPGRGGDAVGASLGRGLEGVGTPPPSFRRSPGRMVSKSVDVNPKLGGGSPARFIALPGTPSRLFSSAPSTPKATYFPPKMDAEGTPPEWLGGGGGGEGGGVCVAG